MAAATTPNPFTHYISPDGIPCKNPGLKPPVSVYGSMMTIDVIETSKDEDREYDSVHSKKFFVYRDLLCFHSSFFGRVLNDPLRAGSSYIHKISDCSVRTFTLFYNWINTGIIVTGPNEKNSVDELDAVHLYKFADSYGIPTLKDYALELYFVAAKSNPYIDYATVHAIYELNSVDSPLRRLVLDLLMDTCEFSMGELKEVCKKSEELATDLLERYWLRKVAPGSKQWNGFSTPELWEKDMEQHFCERYHDHTEVS